jgi:hypothetical protein
MVSSQELSEKNSKDKFWFTKGLKRKKILLFFLCKNGVKILLCHIDKKIQPARNKILFKYKSAKKT